jgi:hypothetical protein
MRLGVAAPVTDLVVGAALGYPLPAFPVVVLVVAAVHRRRSTRHLRRPAVRTGAPGIVPA